MGVVWEWALVTLAAVLSCVAGDGDNDCFVVNLAGAVRDYRMTGTNIALAFTEFTYETATLSTPWYGVDVGDGAVSTCFILCRLRSISNTFVL